MGFHSNYLIVCSSSHADVRPAGGCDSSCSKVCSLGGFLCFPGFLRFLRLSVGFGLPAVSRHHGFNLNSPIDALGRSLPIVAEAANQGHIDSCRCKKPQHSPGLAPANLFFKFLSAARENRLVGSANTLPVNFLPHLYTGLPKSFCDNSHRNEPQKDKDSEQKPNGQNINLCCLLKQGAQQI